MASSSASLSEGDKTNLQASLDQAISSAQLATTYDSQNYMNHQLLGSVYQNIGALGVKDAYNKAMLAYQTASDLNPLNPGIKLAMANTSLSLGNVKEAKEYAKSALSLKQDYVDAMIVLSQIAKKEGNNSEAVSYAKTALSLYPDNQNLKDYLNSLNSSSVPSATPATNKPKQ
jgi:tetratricopeptide (TPR) repeat protein